MSRISDNVDDEKNNKNFENESFHSSAKIPGNTLDYYNEDLSRNAVQGLFSGVEKKDKNTFVVGYDDEERFEPSPLKKRPKPAESFEREKRPPVKPSEKIKERREERGGDDGKGPDEQNRSGKEMEEADYSRYRMRDRFGERPDQASAPASASTASSNKGRGVTPAISISEREKRAPYTTFRKDAYRTTAPAQENITEEERGPREDSLSIIKIVAISASVVVLILLATLIFKINSTNNKLELATKQLKEYEDSGDDINQLKMEKEDLEARVRLLTEELDEYKAAVVSNEIPDSAETETPPTESSGTSANRTYTVKSGDNLSKISAEFYGTVREVDKIKNANNMQGNDIFVGQVLIIP